MAFSNGHCFRKSRGQLRRPKESRLGIAAVKTRNTGTHLLNRDGASTEEICLFSCQLSRVSSSRTSAGEVRIAPPLWAPCCPFELRQITIAFGRAKSCLHHANVCARNGLASGSAFCEIAFLQRGGPFGRMPDQSPRRYDCERTTEGLPDR